MVCFFFFFSSRRRHTRWNCDWSSDVCSSDLVDQQRALEKQLRSLKDKLASGQGTDLASAAVDVNGIKVVSTQLDGADATRSEERRVGKECRSRWSAYH